MLANCECELDFSTDIRYPIVSTSGWGKQKKDKEGWGGKRGDDGKMKKGANEGKKTRRAE